LVDSSHHKGNQKHSANQFSQVEQALRRRWSEMTWNIRLNMIWKWNDLKFHEMKWIICDFYVKFSEIWSFLSRKNHATQGFTLPNEAIWPSHPHRHQPRPRRIPKCRRSTIQSDYVVTCMFLICHYASLNCHYLFCSCF
jgi:hypothetical protein